MEMAGTAEPLSLSVLITRDEYMAFMAQLRHYERSHQVPFLTIIGAVLIVSGIAGLFFGEYILLAPGVCACILVLGLFFACFDGLVAPFLDRAAAAKDYDEKEDIRLATVYAFSKENVKIRNGYMEGTLPLACCTRKIETAGLISLSFGKECHIILPKRLLNEDQLRTLRGCLQLV